MGIVASALITAVGMSKQAKAMKDHTRKQQEMYEKQLALQQAQQLKLDKQLAAYKGFQFTDPYAEVTNPFRNLTVSTEAQRFKARQTRQQLNDVMFQLRGASGGSGIAALAQMVAQQGLQQASQQSAEIAQLEAQNEQLAAQGESARQQLRATGKAMMQEAEFGRESTILGMQYGQLGAAQQATAQAYANQMSAEAAQTQAAADRWTTAANIAGKSAWGDVNWKDPFNLK